MDCINSSKKSKDKERCIKDIIAKEIIKIITEVGELSDKINLCTSFDEIEIDSLKFIAIIVAIELHYKIEFEDEHILIKNYKNIGDFVEYVIYKIELVQEKF